MKGYVCVVVLALFVASCADDKPPAVIPDSLTTAQAIDSIHGKPMHTKRGPADILNDTETNKRQPPLGTRTR